VLESPNVRTLHLGKRLKLNDFRRQLQRVSRTLSSETPLHNLPNRQIAPQRPQKKTSDAPKDSETAALRESAVPRVDRDRRGSAPRWRSARRSATKAMDTEVVAIAAFPRTRRTRCPPDRQRQRTLPYSDRYRFAASAPCRLPPGSASRHR